MTYAPDHNLTDRGLEILLGALDSLFEDYRLAVAKADYFDVTNITEPIAALALKKKKRAHCSAGLAYLSVSAEGVIHRCHRFTGNRLFSLGSVQRAGVDEINAAAADFNSSLMRGAHERVSGCNGCPFVFLCGGSCYHQAATVTKSEFSPIPRLCRYKRKLFQLALKFVCELKTAERRTLLLLPGHFFFIMLIGIKHGLTPPYKSSNYRKITM